jgi:thiamine-monophosphate kinase
MGLQLLEREKTVYYQQVEEARKKGPQALEQLAHFQPDFAGKEYIIERQIKPEARGDVIAHLREMNIRATSMMDISDGLSSELMHICKQSQVGCRIFEKQIPIDYQTAVMAEEMNMNVTTCALNGGEDYELLFTVPIGDHEKIQDLEDIKLIGHITNQSLGQVLVTRDEQEFELKAQGWNPLNG